MKKVISSTLVAVALVTGTVSNASAGTLYNEKALKTMNIHGGYSMVDLDGTSNSGFVGGFGANYYFGDEEKWNFGWLYDYNSGEQDSALGLFDISLGYEIEKNLTIYALAGYMVMTGYTGINYGAGMKYQLLNYVALDLKAHTGELTPISGLGGINETTINVGLEFNFHTSK